MGKEIDYEQISKGFLRTIQDFGEIQAEKQKIQTDIMANEFKSRRNFIWKMMEKNTQTDYQKRLMEMFDKQQGGQGMGRDMPEGDLSQDVFSSQPPPRVNLGAEGPTVSNPQANRTYWIQQLGKKRDYGIQKKGDPFAYFNETEKKWWDKEMGEQTESKQFEESIKLKLSQGENLNPDEVNYYNKFMWRTGNEMKMPKKDKFGYMMRQEYKGYKYIGNNQWQKQ
jgi:hypothetical protein